MSTLPLMSGTPSSARRSRCLRKFRLFGSNALLPERHAFFGQAVALPAEIPAVRIECTLARRCDHTVPGQLKIFRCVAQRIPDLPCTAWNTGNLGDLAIVRNAAFRNVLNGFPNSPHAGFAVQMRHVSSVPVVLESLALHPAVPYRDPESLKSA